MSWKTSTVNDRPKSGALKIKEDMSCSENQRPIHTVFQHVSKYFWACDMMNDCAVRVTFLCVFWGGAKEDRNLNLLG